MLPVSAAIPPSPWRPRPGAHTQRVGLAGWSGTCAHSGQDHRDRMLWHSFHSSKPHRLPPQTHTPSGKHNSHIIQKFQDPVILMSRKRLVAMPEAPAEEVSRPVQLSSVRCYQPVEPQPQPRTYVLPLGDEGPSSPLRTVNNPMTLISELEGCTWNDSYLTDALTESDRLKHQ